MDDDEMSDHHVNSSGGRRGKRGGESPGNLLRKHKAQNSRDQSTTSSVRENIEASEQAESASELDVEVVTPTKLATAGETSAVFETLPLNRRGTSIRKAAQPKVVSKQSKARIESLLFEELTHGANCAPVASKKSPNPIPELFQKPPTPPTDDGTTSELVEELPRTPEYVRAEIMLYEQVDAVADESTVMANKLVNEEYKIWKKNAPYLYDVMFSKALDWPTLTTQWFRDVQNPPGENCSIHRLLIGTHTSNDAPNYLQIAQFSLPTFTADPEDYDAEREEIGSGHNPGKKSQLAPKFNIVQKIDHDGEINKARYMPQNQDLIATMGVAGRVMVFDRTKHSSQPTGKVNPQIELVGHTSEGFGLNWHPKREGELVTGSEDTTVKLWNIKDVSGEGKKIKATRTFTHHAAVVNDVQFHPQIEKAFASVSDDMTLQVIDTSMDSNSRAAFKTENAHTDAINSVSWNTGVEFLLATGSADKTVGIWDMRNLTVKLHSCEVHHDVVSKVEWHPFDKAVLASSGYDRRINFWDLNKTGDEQTPEDAEDGPPELLFMHGGHTNRISDFSFNLNDPWLMCSAAEDNLIQIWKTAKSLIGKDTADVPVQELEH